MDDHSGKDTQTHLSHLFDLSRVERDPIDLLEMVNPSPEVIHCAFYKLRNNMNDSLFACSPSASRNMVARFMDYLNKNYPCNELYSVLMDINTYPWRSIPPEYINAEIAAKIIPDQPHSFPALMTMNLDVTRSELLLMALERADDINIWALLQYIAENDELTDSISQWVLENVNRSHYPEALVEVLKRDYTREYNIKKLKEPK